MQLTQKYEFFKGICDDKYSRNPAKAVDPLVAGMLLAHMQYPW